MVVVVVVVVLVDTLCFWQMITSGLETIFVCDIVDMDRFTIGTGVGEVSGLDNDWLFYVWDGFQGSGFRL